MNLDKFDNSEMFDRFIKSTAYEEYVDYFYRVFLVNIPGMTKERVEELQKQHLSHASDEQLSKLGRFGYSRHPEDCPDAVGRIQSYPKTEIVCIKCCYPEKGQVVYTLTDILGNGFVDCSDYRIHDDYEILSTIDNKLIKFFNTDTLEKISELKYEKSEELMKSTNKIAYIFQNLDKFEDTAVFEAIKVLKYLGNKIKKSSNLKFAVYNFETQKAENIEFQNEQEKLEYLQLLNSKINEVLEKIKNKIFI